MLAIRLQRVGRKHEPVFRLVLTDSKNGPKSGKFLEVLGSYDARRGEQAVFKTDLVKEWMAKGAKVSDTVHNLLVEKKVIDGRKINTLPKKSPIVDEAAIAAAKAAEEAAEAKRLADEKAAADAKAAEEAAQAEAASAPVEPEAPVEAAPEEPAPAVEAEATPEEAPKEDAAA